MAPRISVITLGVDDLALALRFYQDGLGLKTEGISTGQVRTEAQAAQTPGCGF